MSDSRWKMNRAGLLNFWYYDEEFFQFQEGKLLLRGSNGSGKSVTMQSFLPVLLDGKKTPDRLDPFGSKARRMEDYLLGEKEVVDRDERTGYLFLEYKKVDSGQYVTTGIGMQAKRNKGIKSWYFLITDNRRIGIDFQLAQEHAGERVPYSAKELENRIGQGGHLVHTQREYMDLVNKHVFGFSSLEAYDDLIKLLIQLRSPKLSKDFKPTVIYEILESALPPLTDDELRHLSDTVESMDQASQQLEQLEREYESIQRLVSAYDKYNTYILTERADHSIRSRGKSSDAARKAEELFNQKEVYTLEIKRLAKELEKAKQRKIVAEEERQSLEKHEVWSLEKQRSEKTAEEKAIRDEVTVLQEKWDILNRKYYEAIEKKEQIEAALARYEREGKGLQDELDDEAEISAFHQHNVNVEDLERKQLEDFDFSIWQKEAGEHDRLLRTLEKLAAEANRHLEEYNKLQRQSSEKKSLLDGLRKDLDHSREWFEELKQELESRVFQWIQERERLEFSSESRQELARLLQGLYENNRFEAVRDKIYASIHAFEAKIQKHRATLLVQKGEVEASILAAESELVKIKAQKMLEPARHEGTNKQREKLLENGQSFVPFYAAVEFQEHVTEEQRERIEAVLAKTGILDSLIVEDPFLPVHDSMIKPEPRLLGYTLADYLIPDLEEGSHISKDLVDEVLRSIPLEQDGSGFHIDADGTYSIGPLYGDAPEEGPSKYIGRTSRKRHQRKQIQLWTERLSELQQERDGINSVIYRLDNELTVAEKWKKELPNDKELFEVHQEIAGIRLNIKKAEEDSRQIDAEWKISYEKLTQTKKVISEKGKHLNISLDSERIHEAGQASSRYLGMLHRFEVLIERILHSKKDLANIQNRIEEIQEDQDLVKGEQNSKETKLSQLKARVKFIEEQLKLKGVEEVRQRIQEVQEILKDTDHVISKNQELLPEKRSALIRTEEKLEEVLRNKLFWEKMNREWDKLLKKEKDFGFAPVSELDADGVMEAFSDVYARQDRSKLLEQLSKSFLAEQMNLTEYRMFEHPDSADEPEWFLESFGDMHEPFKNEWRQLRSRRLIQLEYRGQRVSPYYVQGALQKELEDQRGWLDERDRQLYEDIIVNTIGNILRSRIQRAQEWVKQMDKIMAARDNSSGLLFSIAWKPLTAESEQEMDTVELVKLLQRNSKFLSESDLERITTHFKSRITKAKELIQLRNEGSTLHQVLKEVLDYRKWFAFVLSFSRVNEPKRELTNNAFFKFSGGEKAMAMYIPLFTAAYSRYKEAGGNAPYIISLDEAFAGVDENNIRDMFEVVEQLGFNYIMNSQSLWGDYDTVSSLAISELVRPKNADYVTVIRYTWDGKQKNLAFDAIADDVDETSSEAGTSDWDMVTHES
jgi:uncharacterized protein (TIGR02680 family)